MSDTGALIGKLLGGALGTAIAPGAGTMIGSSIGGSIGGSIGNKGGGGGSSGGSGGSAKGNLSSIVGLMQSMQGGSLKRKADAYMPPLVDANQAAFLSELNQKRKSIETGADFSAGMNALNASNAGTNDAIIRNSGGDVGGTIQALLQSERATGDAKNNLLAQGANEQMGYNSMYGEFLNKVAARKMQLQLYKSQQARAEWAAKQKDANANMMAGAASLTPGGGTNTAGMSTPAGQNQDYSQMLQGIMNKTAGMGGGMSAPGEGVEGEAGGTGSNLMEGLA